MITIKTKEEIALMREGGKLLAKIMQELIKKVKPGITTESLNRAAEALVSLSGARCSFLGFNGYPACLCTSVNEEIVHAIPSARILKEGDIVSLDMGILYKGFHTDMAVTVPVGRISPEINRLIRVTKKALKRGIKKAGPYNTFGDISNTIQRYIEDQGFFVIKNLCGHGIGRELHEDPEILNYGTRHSGPEIKPGMVFCLEPMVAVGTGEIKKAKDGQAYVTADGSLSAHFEHTIVATKNGAKVLTVI